MDQNKKNNQFISRLSNDLGLAKGWPTDLRLFDQLVNNRGETLVHELAISCPKCRTKENQDIIGRISNCSNCDGLGFLYREPRYISALISGISNSRAQQDFGFAIPGDCTMSISPYLLPGVGDFDKITFTRPFPIDDGEVVVRGIWNERFPQYYNEDEDKISYQGVAGLYCEDENGKVYYHNTDYVFDKRKLKWVNNRPDIRLRYTIKYVATMEWIVFQPENIRIEMGNTLGGRFLLRKKHIAFMQHDKAHQPPAMLKASLNFGEIRQV